MSSSPKNNSLPLPVARLALRSRNAKSSKDRHDTAWYAWEVSIKLAVAASPPADPSKLVRGTVGAWAGALRLPETPLAGEAVQALWELVAREGEIARAKRDSLTPRALIDGLIAYRNRVLGHGALRASSYYEEAAEVLLAALAPLWQAGVFLGKEAELLYCEAIVLGPDGSRLGRLLELSGPLALVKDPRGSAVPTTLLPRRLYLRSPTGWRDLHPWVLYTEGDAAEREALYCFNGLGKTLAEYLDYASGETLRNEGLEKEWPGIVAELRRLFPAATEVKDDGPRQRDAHRLGDYSVLGKLGEGGMGVVYLARQEPLGRLVALKTLPGERAKDPVALARFHQEVSALARCEHPSVVKILSSGQAEGVWYYAMEYVEGADLERVARALSSSNDFGSAVTSAVDALRAERRELFGNLPDVPQAAVRERRGKGRYRDLARYFRDAARGLHHLHERGVLHRDVKPANLMVTAADQRAVVMDLGVAALEGGTLSISHDRSRIVGTLRYMAPEQLQRNLLAVDRRADVYSLGASLYELVCDRPFLEGDSEARLIEQVLKEDPRPLDRHVPDDLARIVRKATDKDPARRYETAESFAEDLENYLAGRPIGARDPEIRYLIRKWVERNRALATTIAASVLLIVTVAAGFTLTLKRKNQDLAKANESLELKSRESEERRREAQNNAERATEQARIAQENEQRADREAAAAIAARDDVLRLSALQRLDDLTTEADRLWPAHPENIERYERWLERAQTLVAELPGHEAKLAGLRTKARPWSAEEQAEYRATHPRAKDLERLERAIAYFTERQVVLEVGEPGPEPTAAEVGVDFASLPAEANGLNSLAWPLVDPERTSFGDERKGLVLARRAVELASEAERAGIRDTRAWALFALARFDEAAAESERALEEAPEDKKAEFEGYLAKLQAAIEAELAPEAAEKAQQRLMELEAEQATVGGELSTRPEWTFEDDQDKWWHNQLEKLVDGIRDFADEKVGLFSEGTSEELGWGVKRRLSSAVALRDGFAPEGEQAQAWAKALPEIRAAHPGLDLTPQLGLVPIGPDPETKLWEFAHLETGEPAVRGADGKLVLSEETGLVFVLLPGGAFQMGAQKTDPNGPNYDPQADGDEGPVHAVTLSAFFLSKYEMTQGQWQRFVGRNPSYYTPGPLAKSLVNPVEQLSWLDCMDVMDRLGLSLPSEAQWEYGARAGTTTAWSTGSERESLRGGVNLADQAAAKAGAMWTDIKDWPELDDGYVVHAPVIEFRPNAFGLHNVHGNVWEWCLDGYDGSFYGKPSSKDPVSQPEGSSNRVNRGGSFDFAAVNARSALRNSHSPSRAVDDLGLRPARTIAP